MGQAVRARHAAALGDGDLRDLVDGGMVFFVLRHRPGRPPTLPDGYHRSISERFGPLVHAALLAILAKLAGHPETGYAVLADEEGLRKMAGMDKRQWAKVWPRLCGEVEFCEGMASLKALAPERLYEGYVCARNTYARYRQMLSEIIDRIGDLVEANPKAPALERHQARFVDKVRLCREAFVAKEAAKARHAERTGRVYVPETHAREIDDVERAVKLRIDGVARQMGIEKTSADVAPEVQAVLQDRARTGRLGRLGWFAILAALVLPPRLFLDLHRGGRVRSGAGSRGTGPPEAPSRAGA